VIAVTAERTDIDDRNTGNQPSAALPLKIYEIFIATRNFQREVDWYHMHRHGSIAINARTAEGCKFAPHRFSNIFERIVL
jgi:hypothetical protein